jgi:hypothetical protein
MARTPQQLSAWSSLLELCEDECAVFKTTKAMRSSVVEVERELKRLHAVEEAAIEATKRWHDWINFEDLRDPENLQGYAMDGIDELLDKMKILVPEAFSAAKSREARMSDIDRQIPPYDGDGCKAVDSGIRNAVSVLWEAGIETFESCEGGPGHSFPEPTIRFHGGASEGFRALAIAMQAGLNVSELRSYYYIHEGLPNGPHWEITFVRK